MFDFLMGIEQGEHYNMVQQGSLSHLNGSDIENNPYRSAEPAHNKTQWTSPEGIFMLNADMAMYHNFTSDS